VCLHCNADIAALADRLFFALMGLIAAVPEETIFRGIM
jgi:membrane protease YdiL (CAAX protease family)